MVRQSVSEFTRIAWMLALIKKDTRERDLAKVRLYEGLAVTRQHHYGIAMHWKALGEMQPARQWAERLNRDFSPKTPPVTPPVFNFNVSIAFTLATAADPTENQFADLYIACGMVDEAEELVRKMEEGVLSEFDWMDCARLWFQLDNVSRAHDCLRKCETDPTEELTESNWLWLAESWIGMDDTTEARRCLMEAEKSITMSNDWRVCAERWQDLGDDKAAKKGIE
ncbi:MAG: hypothetical protein V3R73_04470 [Sphingomonadales bacterium]